jgi:hypothetical protein
MLRRSEAAKHITDTWGIPLSPKTLATTCVSREGHSRKPRNFPRRRAKSKRSASKEPIPIRFAYRRDIKIEADVSKHNQTSDRLLRDVFDTPDLAAMDDAIVNGTL